MMRRALLVTTACALLTSMSVTGIAGIAFASDREGLLHHPRVGHTATLLDDGRVLVVGGTDGRRELAAVELIDTVYETIAIVERAELLTAREGHTATLLPDGRVLIAGGRAGGTTIAGIEVFDPRSTSFSEAGALQLPRAEHSALLLTDGRVLFVGGIDGDNAVARAEVFDPASAKSAETAEALGTRVGAASSLLPDGRVLVTGGATDAALGLAEAYDPAGDVWTAIEGLSANRTHHTSTLLPDGRVLVAGGLDGGNPIARAEMCDPAVSCSGAGELSEPRSDHTATLLSDGRVVILGGVGSGREVYSIELYDPAAGAFTPAGELDIPRVGHTATQLLDGRVLVTGGAYGSLPLDDVSVYHPGLEDLFLFRGGKPELGEAISEAPDTRTSADVRAQYGKPEAFVILYFDEPGPDGAPITTSAEQWLYYADGLEFTFAGGQLVSEAPLESKAGAPAEPVPYDPGQFVAYMSLDEVVSATGVDEYLGAPLEAMVTGGQLYFADRLFWGLQEGELRYVEAVAMEAQGGRKKTE